MSQVGPFTEPTNPVDDQGCQPERALRRSEPEGFSSLGRELNRQIHENNHFKRSAPLRLKLVISRVFDDLVCWLKSDSFAAGISGDSERLTEPEGFGETL